MDEHVPPQGEMSASQIPDLSGKVVLVTGGSGGIGKETAKILLGKNAHVYIAARNATTGEQAVKELTKATGKTPVFLKVDLADLKSIKAAVQEFRSKETKLDILFNNGGVMFPPLEKTTVDGYDLQFGTNVLELARWQGARRQHVLMGHMLMPGLDFDTFKDGPARKKSDPKKLYGQSKFANVVFSNELARRYADRGIVSIALHPGNIKTDLSRHSSRVEQALTLYAGTTAEALQYNGKYLIPWARVGKPHPDTDNAEQAAKLWDWLDAQVKDL
ncbi:NAD-P-binding protein [Mycena vulgaris]|nr:NAD-P-binding protein [Mycena vulgaris]